jgi:hypothetical protein
VQDIRDQYVKKLGAADWMSKSVSDQAIKKGVDILLFVYQYKGLPTDKLTSAQHQPEDWVPDNLPQH